MMSLIFENWFCLNEKRNLLPAGGCFICRPIRIPATKTRAIISGKKIRIRLFILIYTILFSGMLSGVYWITSTPNFLRKSVPSSTPIPLYIAYEFKNKTLLIPDEKIMRAQGKHGDSVRYKVASSNVTLFLAA